MRHILNQTVASTNLDAQGERLSKEFLEQFRVQVGNARFPIHQQHDMSKPVAGYLENLRLLPDERHPGEWCLVADVYYEEGKIEEVIGGFSISGTELLRNAEAPTAFVYLPFPHYNDEELIAFLAADAELNIGKWIKKGAGSSDWVLVGSVIVFAVTPIWDDVYKRKVAPCIDRLLSRSVRYFQRRDLTPELAQLVEFQGSLIEVRLIPEKGKEAECLHSEIVQKGLARVVAFLSGDQKAADVGVKRIVTFYDDAHRTYFIHRVEYADGTVEHLA